MVTLPPHRAAPRRDAGRVRPTVIALADVRRRRCAPVLQVGFHRFRVVNPRLQHVARWVARAGWQDWIDWLYESEG